MTPPHWIEHYLRAPYADGGRGPEAYDCWGLVREVRHKHCGARLLPEWGGIPARDIRNLSKAYEAERAAMERCDPEPGAIAAVMRGPFCYHVAVVVELEGALWVLETGSRIKGRRLRLAQFLAVYNRVEFYRDR